MARRAWSLHTLQFNFMTPNLEKFVAPRICGIITALVAGSVCMEWSATSHPTELLFSFSASSVALNHPCCSSGGCSKQAGTC